MNRDISRRAVLGAGVLALVASVVGCAPPQTAYNPSGEGIVDVVIPYSTGGGTDTWGRFITPYFAEKQPDVNRYQIENIPGGESITGTNAFVHTGVTDGQQLLVSSATTYFQGMLGQSTVDFDFSEMEPLVLNGTGAVLWTSTDSGIDSVEDLIGADEPFRYGGMSASGLDLVPLLALEALGADVRGVFGMEGRGPTRLAVQRGESDLDFQTTATYLSQVEPLVENGDALPLFAIGTLEDGEVIRDPNLPEDIPTFEELYEQFGGKTEHERPAYEAYQAFVVPGFFYQKGLWANVGTDEDVVQSYTEMVHELNADDEFLAESDSALGGYELIAGGDARDSFREALEMDEEVLEFTKQLLTDKYDAVLD